VETLWQDIKFGVRSLAKKPVFTLIVVLTLGLGIGANTAIFSVVNALLLRPMPVQNPDELAVVAIQHPGNEQPHGVSYLDFLDYRANSNVFQDMSAFRIGFVGLSDGQRADRLAVSFVTSNYFTLFGVEPAAGRLIQPGEGDKPGGEPIIVLGNGYWKRRFGGNPGVVGKSVRLNGKTGTVIGVVPEKFKGAYALVEMDAYLPLGMAALDAENRDLFEKRDSHDLHVRARLKPGVTVKQAQASLEVIARQLDQQYPDTNKQVTVRVIPEWRARPEPNAADQNPLVAGVFLALVGLVLLVACVNVTNLLLVRASVRQKELAIRAALGAGRLRLVRQLLTESVLLAMLGGAAGILIGVWASEIIASIRLPMDIPIQMDFSFDWRVFGYVSAVALLAGFLVGIVPALRASRTDLNEALREGGRAQAGGGRHRVRNVLVVAQVAGSLVLLIAAGLFVRSLNNAQSVDLGFRPAGVLNLIMDPGLQGYDEAKGKVFYRELKERVRALPGVQSASYAFSVPLGYYNQAGWIDVAGKPVAKDERRPSASYNLVDPEYFGTLGITLLRGRAISREDSETTRRVAVINETMARKLWPGEEAIGKRFSFRGPQGPWVEVIGISKNGKYGFIFEDPEMNFYAPLEQNYVSLRALQVRTNGVPPASLAQPIQKEIRALDADLPVFDVRTMTEALEGGNGFLLLRMGAVFAAALGLLGLVLAVVGVYGVVSYTANQRTHEIGIRMALGAQRGDILKLVVGQGLGLVGIGVAAGLAAAFGLSRFLANFLFGISTRDPVTFAGVSLLLGGVALVACWIPARRAAKVEPVVALRYE
jgi:predicted permease